MKFDLDDTIAAIATAFGESGIGIIRISGAHSLSLADKIFLAKDKKKPSQCLGYTMHYGWIVNTAGSQVDRLIDSTQCPPQNIIDEVLLTVMRAPKTYTREDVVEINCHGGIIALRAVLDLVLEKGCRLAHPGEFTKRAFINGRIDLSQAEAVLDIIRAKTNSALEIGVQQLKGTLSERIGKIRCELLEVLAQIEANIDFPEEGITPVSQQGLRGSIDILRNEFEALLRQNDSGRLYREGLFAVICGRPNVGKSSLLNALLKQERSIVTHIAGTTRDTIEEVIDIKGIPVRIADTAGIASPRDLVEKRAVQRTGEFMDKADLIILMFDGNSPLSREDEVLIGRIIRKKKSVIAVINKSDLKQKIEKEKIARRFGHTIDISAKRLKNIDSLKDAIANLAYKGKVHMAESVLVSNLRHIQSFKKAHRHIVYAANSVDANLSLEFVSQDLKEAFECLDAITGKRFSEDLLDRIFSEFCIGK